MIASEDSAKVAQTKRLIESQFKILLGRKSIQKISVNEICKCTMISRSTFYLHFQDKYELLKYCLDREFQRWSEAADKRSVEEYIVFALDSILAERNFYYNAFWGKPTNELLVIARDSCYRMFLNRLTEKQAEGIDVPQPVSTVAAFYAGAVISTIEQWLYEDLSITKEELAKCMKNLIPSWIIS